MCSSFRVCLSGPVREKGWVDVWSQTNLKTGPADRFENGKSPDRMKVAPKHPVLSVCFLLSFAKLESTRRQTSVKNSKLQVPGAGRFSEPLLRARRCLMCRVVRQRYTIQALRVQV